MTISVDKPVHEYEDEVTFTFAVVPRHVVLSKISWSYGGDVRGDPNSGTCRITAEVPVCVYDRANL